MPARLTGVKLTALGHGAWSAAYNLLLRFFPWPLHLLAEGLAVNLDRFFARLAKWRDASYTGREYPLGYLAIARRES